MLDVEIRKTGLNSVSPGTASPIPCLTSPYSLPHFFIFPLQRETYCLQNETSAFRISPSTASPQPHPHQQHTNPVILQPGFWIFFFFSRSDFDLKCVLACNVWLNHISAEIHFLASLTHPLPVFSFLYNFSVGTYIYICTSWFAKRVTIMV